MCTAGNAPFRFTWWPGTFLSDSTISNPLTYINKDSWYHVKTVGRNGCIVTDSGFIKVPVHHYDIWPKDTSFCYGQSFKMISMGDFANVKWMEVQPDGSYTTVVDANCDDCREPIATPLEDTKYAAIMTDIDGCSDTMTLTARVKPLPLVHIINNDTTIKYGQSIQLYVSGAYLYSWQPISSLTNPNISNPYATPTEPTKYYVQGLGENGCRNIDSVTIKIDYRDNLFVPSAFTPNGDGSNDVFRVVNITFQKLQEFRIFNRWGQEIYSTTDPKKGWDGSWKGVPQDIGSYQYLIKVAYPDGYIETYKGDVTLVR
jgi:gliding motility-associated-like protein